jgi:hypothetical protein
MDFASPEGKLMFTQFAGWAQYYSENLSRLTTAGKHKRAQKGIWNGDAPLGYKKVPTGQSRSGTIVYRLEIDELEAEAVRMVFTLTAQGFTALQIAHRLNAQGFLTKNKTGPRQFQKESVRAILNNVFYTGVVTYKGETVAKGEHQPVISRQQFDEAQEVKNRNYNMPLKASVTSRTYPLAGIAYCSECGSRLHGQALNKGIRYYRDRSYDKCIDCSQPRFIKSEDLEAMAAEVISAIALSDADIQYVLEQSRKMKTGLSPSAERKALLAQLSKIKSQLMEDRISGEDYDRQKKELQKQLGGLGLDVVVGFDSTKALAMMENFSLIYQNAFPDERKRLFRGILEKAFVSRSDGLTIEAIQPTIDFYPIFEGWGKRTRRVRNTELQLINSFALRDFFFRSNYGN